jgi:hypothetical protein
MVVEKDNIPEPEFAVFWSERGSLEASKEDCDKTMHAKLLIAGALGGALSLLGQRVTGSMTANIRGGGGEGKCTIEVWVDDVAEVEIRGQNAVIRTINGQPATFRRFVCNQAMPMNPSGFRFKGIDGRGRQDLVRQPGGGPAVIRIEDSKGGGEGYTFDIFWSGGSGGGFGGGGFGGGGGGGYNRPGYGGGGGGYTGGPGSGWNNGWGSGSGWSNAGDFNFEGGRRGSGSYRDRNGQTRRLDAARVSINDGGNLTVSFQSDSGTIQFNGRIERRDGRRVYAQVNGSGMYGQMELEMSARDTVRRISLQAVDLFWNN